MKKIIFLMPVFNDWTSLEKVLIEINQIIGNIKDYAFDCLIINDASSEERPKMSKPKNFNSVKILNMKKNKGHARCNAFGIRHINKNENFDYIIIMDSDGEDRPVEIKSLIDKIRENKEISVVAKRIKRSEGIVFQALYQIHKFITYVFTGQKINFGNYSCLTKKDVNILSSKPSIWSSFSGTLKKNLRNYNEVESTRGLRYFGPSKMSIYNLTIHSLSIIAVFKYTVFLRSAILIFLISFLLNILSIGIIIFLIMIVIFNLLIFVISFRENEEALLSSHENVLSEDVILH